MEHKESKEQLAVIKYRISTLKHNLRRDDYTRTIDRETEQDELEALEWAIRELEGR